MRERRKFDEDFKAKAMARVVDGGEAVSAVVEDLDLTETSFRGWLKKAGWTGPGRGGKPLHKAKANGKSNGHKHKAKAAKEPETPDAVADLVGETGAELGGVMVSALGKAYAAGVTAGKLQLMNQIGAMLDGDR